MKDYNVENENTEYTGFSADGAPSPKKPKKHTGAKIVAYLAAIALVSGGSISAYKAVSEKFSDSRAVVSEDVEDEDEEEEEEEETAQAAKKSKAEVSTVSLIKTEKSDSKALSTEEVVEKMIPTVVGIESTFEITQSYQQIPNDFFGFGGFGFGGFDDYSSPQTSEATATGTGVIVSKDGYIVTNAHVIYDNEYGGEKATSISVLLEDGTKADAEIIGYDVYRDLAVLKIDTDKDLPYAEFGDSDALKLGESVIAIGNPLGFDLKNTVTGGMISGLDRSIIINDSAMNLIQTDAAINSGNSGGPLINKYGQVIGINSSKMSSSYSGEASIEGIGFAIPSNQVSKIVDELIENGFIAKPRLGINGKGVSAQDADLYGVPQGVLITAVAEDSAAEEAGLKKRDIITAVDGKNVTTIEQISAVLNTHSAGDEMKITFYRNGDEKTVTAVLKTAEEPDDQSDDDDDAEVQDETKAKSKSKTKAQAQDDEE